MSGHSKWSQIKRKKEVKDIKKGKVFSKLSRLITLAVLEGAGLTDPEKNVKLRLTIDQARQANMPKDNIQRAIEKGSGPDKEALHEAIYEGFGPEGVALLIQVTTDNANRSFSEVRGIFDRYGGKMVSQGSVSYLFKKCGLITFSKKANPEDKIFQFAESIQALDIENEGETFSVYLPFENLGKVSELLNELTPESPAEIDYKPLSTTKVEDPHKAKKILEFVERLEDHDDIQNVYCNFDIPDKLIKFT